MNSTELKLREVVHKRSKLLTQIVNEPNNKADIINRSSKSRSTVTRGLESLQEMGCVQYQNGKYKATSKGKISLSEYTKYIKTLKNIEESGNLLNAISDGSAPSPQFIHGMEVHEVDPQVPDAALEKSREILRSSKRMVGLAPTARLSYTKVVQDAISQNNTSVEIIIESKLYNKLQDIETYNLNDFDSTDDAEILTYNGKLPYSLWIMESDRGDIAGITVHDSGNTKGVLINDSPKAVEWAWNTYQQYKEKV